MRIREPELLEGLAGEYVLGVLIGPARRRFERLCAEDAAAADAVHRWQARLGPLATTAPGAVPPARVWREIERRVSPARPAAGVGFWESLALWRGAAAIAVLVLAAVSVHLVLLPPPPVAPGYVAVLAGPDGKPVLVASAAKAPWRMSVRVVAPPDLPADRTLELWYLPRDGTAPVSAGLLAASGVTEWRLSREQWERLADTGALAVSLEPPGGSPTGAPTGPVLYSGPCVKLG